MEPAVLAKPEEVRLDNIPDFELTPEELDNSKKFLAVPFASGQNFTSSISANPAYKDLLRDTPAGLQYRFRQTSCYTYHQYTPEEVEAGACNGFIAGATGPTGYTGPTGATGATGCCGPCGSVRRYPRPPPPPKYVPPMPKQLKCAEVHWYITGPEGIKYYEYWRKHVRETMAKDDKVDVIEGSAPWRSYDSTIKPEYTFAATKLQEYHHQMVSLMDQYDVYPPDPVPDTWYDKKHYWQVSGGPFITVVAVEGTELYDHIMAQSTTNAVPIPNLMVKYYD
jgi:hypothetical protein